MKKIITYLLIVSFSLLSITACSGNQESGFDVSLPISTIDTNNTTTNANADKTTNTNDASESSSTSDSTANTSTDNNINSITETTIDTSGQPTQGTQPQPQSPSETVIPTMPDENPVTTAQTEKPKTTAPVIIPDNTPQNTYKALNYDDVKAVWLTYIELNPIITKSKTADAFKTNITPLFDNIKNFGLNTVYVHVRSHGDANYHSSYFPYNAGQEDFYTESRNFDPLEIMVKIAHERKLSIHAWVNPLRLGKEASVASLDDYYLTNRLWTNSTSQGNHIVPVGGYLYLNPAYTEVIELVARGAEEIITNYNVDGLHIDDYFYPTSSESFDKNAFANSNFTDLTQFRINNTNRLVKTLYNTVKKSNPTALFGVSPGGNTYRTNSSGVPTTDAYIDVANWIKNDGYIDYIAPQIYWDFNHSTEPYQKCLDAWYNLTKGTKTKLLAGLAVYKAGVESGWTSETDILKKQAIAANKLGAGVILYKYDDMFNYSLSGNEKTRRQTEIANIRTYLKG